MDFTTLIEKALADGQDAEGIAKAFAEALNKVELNNKKDKEIEDYLNSLHTIVDADVADNEITFRTAAATATLAALECYNWTKEEFENYRESAEKALEMTADLANSLNKDASGFFDKIFDNFAKEWEIIFKPNKSKDKDEDDDAKLKRFLSHFNYRF